MRQHVLLVLFFLKENQSLCELYALRNVCHYFQKSNLFYRAHVLTEMIDLILVVIICALEKSPIKITCYKLLAVVYVIRAHSLDLSRAPGPQSGFESGSQSTWELWSESGFESRMPSCKRN